MRHALPRAFCPIVAVAVASLAAFAQQPPPQTPTAAQPPAATAQPPSAQLRRALPARPRLASRARASPRARSAGRSRSPARPIPGTQHTYWVYVPAQYDPAMPASLMIFNDGQAFKNMEGDVRAPNVLDNLIYRREIPVMLGGVHQPGPHARAAGADAAGMGRPDDQPADRVQLARRQVRPRHRRRADARALQGIQHLEGSRAARHRRRQLRRDRRVHRRLGAARRLPQGAQHRRQLRRTCAAATPIPTSSARARRSRSGSSCRTAATTTAASAAAAPTTRRATGSSRTCG